MPRKKSTTNRIASRGTDSKRGSKSTKTVKPDPEPELTEEAVANTKPNFKPLTETIEKSATLAVSSQAVTDEKAVTEEAVGSDFTAVDSEDGKVVDVIVDQRWQKATPTKGVSPEPENPQPIHPMDAMTAKLNEPTTGKLTDDTLAANDGKTITVEAIDTTTQPVPPSIREAEATVESTLKATALEAATLEVTTEAIAVDIATKSIEVEVESVKVKGKPSAKMIDVIQDPEQQKQQRLLEAEGEAQQLAQALAAAELRESSLNQENTDLKEELSQVKTQVMQIQSRLNDQDKNQREIDKLMGEVSALKDELAEAKRYILQLTKQPTKTPSVAPKYPFSESPSQGQSQSSTTFPPPLTQRPPHTRVVASPHPQRRPVSRPSIKPISPVAFNDSESSLSKSSPGLPPMSTERFGSNSVPVPSQRSSSSLRSAYTRPGFSKSPSSFLAQSSPPSRPGFTRPTDQASQPMLPLESHSRHGDGSDSSPALTNSDASTSTSVPSNSAAIVPTTASSISRRRSRYDELKPELNASDIPQPKVSDAEIGWFD